MKFGSLVCAMFLAICLSLSPVSSEEEKAQGGSPRQWKIVLKSGAQITFRAGWNWITPLGPSALRDDLIQYHRDRTVKTELKAYAFPMPGSQGHKKAAEIWVNVADIETVIQVFE